VAVKTSVSIRVLSNKLPHLPAELESDVTADVKRAAFEVEALAKAKAPVRTGTLRRSIHTVFSNNDRTAVVGPSVDYGLYVEMGTRRMAARPYMRPAAEAVLPRYVDRLKVTLRTLGK
jgi:HK97 gp10 family phage protein